MTRKKCVRVPTASEPISVSHPIVLNRVLTWPVPMPIYATETEYVIGGIDTHSPTKDNV